MHLVALSKRAEETGRVVDQRVDAHLRASSQQSHHASSILIGTYKLLEEHDSHTDDGAFPASATETVPPRCDLKFEVASAAAILQVGVPLAVDFRCECNFGTDLKPLPVDPRICGGQTAQFGQDDKSLIIAAFAAQPARREGQEHDTGGEDKSRDHLNEEWEPPRPLTSHIAGTVCCPEGDDDAKDDAEFLEDEEGATNLRRGDFGYVKRSNGSQSECC